MTPRRTLLIAGLSIIPFAAARSQPDLDTQIVDALEVLFGVHPGARRVHAKGRLYDGRFSPAPEAARLSRAPQFTGVVPVLVRFSDGPGVPGIADGDPDTLPPGMAIRFLTPDGRPNDIVAHGSEGFPVRNGEDFLAFLRAVAASGPGVPAPTPLQRFVAVHPETQQFLGRRQQQAASFATTRYFGNTAMVFEAADGSRRAFRYVIEPAVGLAGLSPEERRARPPDFLFDELTTRLRAAPVRFTVTAQLASPSDPTNDVTALWPSDRQRVELGTVEVTGLHGDQSEELQLFYDPNNLPDGIQASDDPLLPLRQRVYGVSIARRTAPR
ncbi:catalase family peroxidase [Belnapia sp. T18]|uniref:Catalase-related peroxidase n=1 Tax=Belnapia arida TaxID=2804533 RepID=A0ABS1UCV3_9PROT|nr:catalase family peroxidase [Belnapia arida]MBL6081985.1 catalase family peroxidase [Belnapia arida]